ncbi:hypothetical protein CPB83DRAFT_837286 [Crepidotus variabilis]|uniref:L-tyrosine decarboxylase C-terminal domain-containing protein n=1 Tax=Crepidotus variabilis TaxID=179855 RepID=A0A9P6JMN8_9AGAR|nr:hypothetical protein CPB83DRAFT_837286 [Crepidotus variabilis]
MEHYVAVAQLTSAALDKEVSKDQCRAKIMNALLLTSLETKLRLVAGVLSDNAEARCTYHPEDPAFITMKIQGSDAFQQGIGNLEKNFKDLSDLLREYSVPFFSPRYAGHMCFETSMPAILGCLMTILYNPNNVAFEASPITTLLELDVGTQMCRMLGYETDATSSESAWGHIACDGTIANLESIWAARNLKFYPLSLREAMKEGRSLASSLLRSTCFKIHACAKPDEEVLLSSLETWDFLNLRVKEILDIPAHLPEEYGISSKFLQDALQPYLVQTTGKDALERAWKLELPAQYLINNTKHYSWPKGAGKSIAGIGSENMVNVPVDHEARVSINLLEKALEERLVNKQPVYAVVGIVGSTEEGAVDPVDKILELRDEFEARGLSFVVHADAVWGGYFAAMIRDPDDYARAKIRNISVNFSFVYNLIGRFGVYGKPGAPASAVWLHHAVVGLHKEGYGMLLGEVAFTCSRFSAHWAAISDKSTPFIVIPFNPLVNEDNEAKLEEEKKFIRKHILPKSNEQLVRNRLAMKELRALGSDLNINAFACNFCINGKDNTDIEEANYLNNRVFQALSVTSTDEKPADTPMFLSATTSAMADYGECCTNFKRRMGLEVDSSQDLFVLRNVVMSPFQSAGNFVNDLADIFQETLEREMKEHRHPAETLEDGHAWKSYVSARTKNPAESYCMDTQGSEVLTDLLKKGQFAASIHGKGLSLPLVRVKNIHVIKDRTLLSRYRNRDYYSIGTPFYLYGTEGQQHIDHMLLRAPNSQLCADQVKLDLDHKPTSAQLAKGLIAIIDRHEASMQPMVKTNPPKFFAGNAKNGINVYKDPDAPDAHGPGLAKVDPKNKIATGSITLGSNVHVEYENLNNQGFALGQSHHPVGAVSRSMSDYTKREWMALLKELVGCEYGF